MGWSEEFDQLANDTNLSVCIIGLGYVGLPTAIGFFEAGYNVWGADISQKAVDKIMNGINPTGDKEIDGLIPDSNTPRWNITTSTSKAVSKCDVVIVTVPTPVTKDLKPDLSFIYEAGKSIFKSIKKNENTIVVLESTVYPGVTNQTWLPLIEKFGLKEGIDIEIAYCPERFNPGDPSNGVRKVARVIGARNPKIGHSLVQLYKKLTSGDVRYVGRIEVAEAAKVVENVQRDINIALVNELARIFPEMGVDVEDVLSAAETKWNFHRYTPGVGVGGHCIPVDPYYMMQRAADVGVPAELITAARAVNKTMPIHVANNINDILYKNDVSSGNGRVLLLGWSYKPEVGDPRETPAEDLWRTLHSKDIGVTVYDSHLDKSDFPQGVDIVDSPYDAKDIDMVVLITAHQSCINIDWSRLKNVVNKPLIFDGRRVLDTAALSETGWLVYGVGMPL